MDASSPALEAQRSAHPELGGQVDELQKFANSKLYHQLTHSLLQYLSNPPFAASAPGAAKELMDFFSGFIKPYESKFNKLRWLQIVAIVCKPQAPDVALDLLAPLEAGAVGDRDAKLFWQILKAEKLTLSEKYDDAKEILEALNKEISDAYEVDALIQSNFHKTYALLWKRIGRPHMFFKSSLMYLAFTQYSAIPVEERPQLAFEVGVAALVAEEEFIFGELLQQELLTSVDGTEYAWIKDLLQAFGEGKFDLYDEALAKHQAKIAATPELQKALDSVLRPKMAALALMELCFRKPKKQRRLTFDEVAQHCRIGLKEVERLVMKAMYAELISGKIDEVNSLVLITWVKPRILDNVRIDLMRERMDAWAAQTGLLLDHVEEMTPELLVS